MKTNLLDYLNGKEIKCWYPCSGSDFDATKLYETQQKSSEPSLFVYTDLSLFDHENDINKYCEILKYNLVYSDIVDLNTEHTNIQFDRNDNSQKQQIFNLYIENLKKDNTIDSNEKLELIDLGVFNSDDLNNEEYYNSLDNIQKKLVNTTFCNVSSTHKCNRDKSRSGHSEAKA